jgi:hypothetical protein
MDDSLDSHFAKGVVEVVASDYIRGLAEEQNARDEMKRGVRKRKTLQQFWKN